MNVILRTLSGAKRTKDLQMRTSIALEILRSAQDDRD